MSTRWTGPQAVAAGSMKWQILWVPKVTVSAARTCGSGVSPVSTSTPDGVSTATIGTSYSSADSTAAKASGRRPGRPPMPTMPSTTTSAVRMSSVEPTRPPAAFKASRPAA